MGKGVGSGGISTEGLFFSVDAFNLKSYIPPLMNPTISNVTCASYSNFELNRVFDNTQSPTVISVVGDVSTAWSGYFSSTGTITLLLDGGAFPESYNVDKVLYDPALNLTVLYPNFSANYVTMSHTCSMGNWFGGGQNFVKIASKDRSLLFNAYFANGPLVFSLTGGGGPIVTATAIGASYSGFSLNRVSDNTQQPIVIGLSGNAQAIWMGYLAGGTISVHLSGGSIPEIFDVNGVVYDNTTDTTVLYHTPTANYVTMSSTCSVDTGFGPNLIRIADRDLSNIFNIYFAASPAGLGFGMTGGAIPEVYTCSNVFFDGTGTIIYDGNFTGMSYTDHTAFEVLVPEMIGTQYLDNTIFTFSYAYYPETYSVNAVYFDGTDTYVYDNGFIGADSLGHSEFTVSLQEIPGIQYFDHTNATFSYIYVTPQTASNDLSSRGHNMALHNGVGFDGRSFVFDGVDDYINVGVLGSSFSSFTLDMWFNSGSVVDYKNLIDFNGFNVCLRIEQYTAPGFVASWRNLGGGTGRARMSININGTGDGFGVGGDCPGDILQDQWYNLIVSYNGNGYVNIENTTANEYDGFVLQRVDTGYPTLYTIILPGDVAASWNNWIDSSGGTMSTVVSQTYGTYSSLYVVSSAFYESGFTHLVPVANTIDSLTVSGLGYIDDVALGFNCLRLGGVGNDVRWDKIFSEVFSVFPSLTMSLVSGTYSQLYIVDSASYSSPYTYIYDIAGIGATMMLPGTFSTFDVFMPKMGLDVILGTSSGYDKISAIGPTGSICSMYINGDTFLDQWNVAGGFVGYINDMRIGDGYDYSSRRFQGKIPFVSIYDRALSRDESITNYEELKWRFI